MMENVAVFAFRTVAVLIATTTRARADAVHSIIGAVAKWARPALVVNVAVLKGTALVVVLTAAMSGTIIRGIVFQTLGARAARFVGITVFTGGEPTV